MKRPQLRQTARRLLWLWALSFVLGFLVPLLALEAMLWSRLSDAAAVTRSAAPGPEEGHASDAAMCVGPEVMP